MTTRKGMTDPRMTVDAERTAAVTRADTYGTDMIGWVQKGEGDAPKSRQVKDPFENLYTYGGAIIPPLDPYKLLQLVENNAIHSACITAKSADSVGRGWTWEAEEKDADTDKPKELDQYLEEATPNLSFSELLRQAVMEQETVGWSAWEVQRRSDLDMYTGSEPVFALFPMPSHTIRATQDENVWVQIKNVAIRYFKVFGCRDPYDAVTGKPATAKQLKAYMQKDPRAQFEPAREIIVFKSYSPRSPYYGIPPWISAMPALAELQAIREFNISFFQSGGTVDRIIHVTAADADQAQVIADKVLQTIKDASGRGHVTVVTSGNAQSGIDVKPMNGPQGPVGGRDAQFVRRREDLIKEVLMAHTMPGYRIGLAEFGPVARGTEVLTTHGWIPIEQATTDETVMTLNLATDRMEFQPVQQTHRYYYDKMVRMSAKGFEMVVSPDHRMWARRMPGWPQETAMRFPCYQYRWYRAADLLENKRRAPSAKWIVRTSGIYAGRGNMPTPEEGALVGWIVSEGSMRRTPGSGVRPRLDESKRDSIQVNLHQRAATANLVESALMAVGTPFSKTDYTQIGRGVFPNGSPRKDTEMVTFRLIGSSKREWYERMDGKKRVPEEFFHAPVETRLALLGAAIAGDGHVCGNGVWRYVSKDRGLADDIATLAMISGMPCRLVAFKDQWHIWGRSPRAQQERSVSAIEEIPYDDDAFCLTVPNGTLLYRWKGHPYIAGNSLGGGGAATKELLRAYKVGAIEAAQTVIEDRLNHTLFGPSGFDVKGYKWKLETLDWDETEMNLEIATQGTTSGILTPNEGRQTIGRERFEDPAMDIPHTGGPVVPLTSTEEVKTMNGMIGEWKTALEAAIRGPVMTPPPGAGMLGPGQPAPPAPPGAPTQPSEEPVAPAMPPAPAPVVV